MPPDDPINFLRQHWHDEAVPAGLAERIMQTARVQPQWQPWWVRLTQSLGSMESGWQLKGAALAAFAMIGLLSGQLNTTPALSQHPLHFSWTEEL